MAITIERLCRYPVKGLTAERLEHVSVAPGEALPEDRRFALAHGASQFDPFEPAWLPKTNFLMLLRDEKLAQLDTHFDPETGCLTIHRAGRQVVRANATEPVGRAMIGQFFAEFMGASARGAVRLVESPGHMFSDVAEKVVSLINLASVRDLERVIRAPVDPIRFRANVYFEGAEPWAEFDWVGQEIGVGEARLRVVKRIQRCAATNVDPRSAARDLNIPRTLQKGFGHTDLGVYAAVTAAGHLRTGDTIAVAPPQ